MTKQDFVAEITAYYGNFANETVYKQFVRVLKRIADKDLERLLDWTLANVPSRFPVDVKTLTDGVRACFIQFVEEKKHCPVCGALIAEESQICVFCGYHYDITPEEYRATFADAADVSALMTGILEKLQRKCESLKPQTNQCS